MLPDIPENDRQSQNSWGGKVQKAGNKRDNPHTTPGGGGGGVGGGGVGGLYFLRCRYQLSGEGLNFSVRKPDCLMLYC